jgi:hypothetical protein
MHCDVTRSARKWSAPVYILRASTPSLHPLAGLPPQSSHRSNQMLQILLTASFASIGHTTQAEGGQKATQLGRVTAHVMPLCDHTRSTRGSAPHEASGCCNRGHPDLISHTRGTFPCLDCIGHWLEFPVEFNCSKLRASALLTRACLPRRQGEGGGRYC